MSDGDGRVFVLGGVVICRWLLLSRVFLESFVYWRGAVCVVGFGYCSYESGEGVFL